MKLELKHLAGYLPYGLVFRYDSEPSEYLMLGLTKESIKLDEATEDLKPCWVGYNDYYKPILRPLSDLGKKHIDYMWFELLGIDNEIFDKLEFIEKCELYQIDFLPIIVYEYLLKNHFDVHNLIEKDLAININDLNK